MVARVLLLIAFCTCIGCMPGTKVVKNPADNDKGIRFYRPKPYLLVTPAGTRTEHFNEQSKLVKAVSETTDEFVEIKLEYLPDFSEEYSVRVTSGLGIANVNIKLENGWNLTQVDQELDSQFNENVTAIADLTRAVGGVITPTGPSGRTLEPTSETRRWTTRATNVPIGYYESVIGVDPCGVKRLFGWRYVGFAPFNGCPADYLNCDTDPACDGVYGLVFENGAMVFKKLGSISPDTTRVPVETGTLTLKSSADTRTPNPDLLKIVSDALTSNGIAVTGVMPLVAEKALSLVIHHSNMIDSDVEGRGKTALRDDQAMKDYLAEHKLTLELNAITFAMDQPPAHSTTAPMR